MLQADREQLLRRIDELTSGGEVDMDFDDDFADRAQVAGEKGENLTLAAALQDKLTLVNRALARIDDGSYGSCEVCGNPISAERLDAIPTAYRCIDHVAARR
jgi:RNA polymerase-binding transcription factor DksA